MIWISWFLTLYRQWKMNKESSKDLFKEPKVKKKKFRFDKW